MAAHRPRPDRRCPFADCPSHAQPSSSGIVRHGFMRSRHGARLRLLCRTCKRTFCNRRGTAYYRLQHPRGSFDRFASILSEGLSCASLARTLHVCPGTITRWLARAARHARAFADEHDRIREPTELQLDEISARPASQPKSPWIFNALEVGSRYWAAAVVGRRTRRSTRAFVLQFRRACVNIPTGLVITSDPFPYYLRELDRSFGPACTYVHAQTDYRQDCVLRTNASLLIGSQWRLEEHFARSEDSKRPNTAYVERLNLFLRRSCSYLHRRTSGCVRNPERLASAVEILRCGYNFIRPHARLRLGPLQRTPAMYAGCFDRPLSWRSVFAWPLAPKRPNDVLREAISIRRRVRPPTVRLTSLTSLVHDQFELPSRAGT